MRRPKTAQGQATRRTAGAAARLIASLRARAAGRDTAIRAAGGDRIAHRDTIRPSASRRGQQGGRRPRRLSRYRQPSHPDAVAASRHGPPAVIFSPPGAPRRSPEYGIASRDTVNRAGCSLGFRLRLRRSAFLGTLGSGGRRDVCEATFGPRTGKFRWSSRDCTALSCYRERGCANARDALPRSFCGAGRGNYRVLHLPSWNNPHGLSLLSAEDPAPAPLGTGLIGEC